MLSDAVVRPNQAKLLRFTTKFEPLRTMPLTTVGEKISKQIGAENSMFSGTEKTVYSRPRSNSDMFAILFLSHEAIPGNHSENGIVSPNGIRNILL